MHKLWPHSVKSQTSSKITSYQKTQEKPLNSKSEKTSETNSSSNVKSDKENNPNEAKNNSNEAQSQSENQKDSKTPMCLINELVKYNKVNSIHVKFIQVYSIINDDCIFNKILSFF